MGQECRQIELGRSDSIPEYMVKWEGSPIPHAVTYQRSSSMVAFAEICAPADLLNESWHDIITCSIAAAAAAGVALIIAGPEAATPAVNASFMPCLGAKLKGRAQEVQIALSTQQKSNNDWHK
ncbi:hypothetical protein [Lichenicoccus sp.]|uniref:hypothetical protein n=1 Tax=Lichenicoccus sp. TaxID=2781899 RepID=UPI003D12FCF8